MVDVEHSAYLQGKKEVALEVKRLMKPGMLNGLTWTRLKELADQIIDE